MKKNDIQKLKTQDVAVLRKDVENTRNELQELRLSFASGKVKNIRAIKEAKKKIARLLTILANKEHHD